jgi:hypothetical protein
MNRRQRKKQASKLFEAWYASKPRDITVANYDLWQSTTYGSTTLTLEDFIKERGKFADNYDLWTKPGIGFSQTEGLIFP